MKKFTCAAIAVALILAMTVCAFASRSVTRVESVFEVQKATVTDANGNKIALNPYDVIISDIDKTSGDEVKNSANKLTELVPNLADALPTGVVAEDLTVVQTCDVSVSNSVKGLIANGGSVRINFIVPGVKKGQFVVALHKGENGWEALEATAVGLNNVAVNFTSFSPVAFVTLKGVTVNGSVTSPATGLEIAPVADGVVAACAAAM